MGEGCVFCKIAAGQIPSTGVYSDDEFYAFQDIHPLAPTHVLLIPRKHIAKLTDAKPADEALLGRLLLKANEIAAQEGLAENGYRLAINCGPWGGQVVFHLHVHILGGRRLADSLG
jgi:histidine triad (HIT) family protein